MQLKDNYNQKVNHLLSEDTKDKITRFGASIMIGSVITGLVASTGDLPHFGEDLSAGGLAMVFAYFKLPL